MERFFDCNCLGIALTRAMNRHAATAVLISSLLLSACGGSDSGDNPSPSPTAEPSCSRDALALMLTSELEMVTTDVDFSFYLEDAQGDFFSYNRGSSTLDTPYQSASTSKWVSAAVILQLVDRELMDLDDTPQVYLTSAQWDLPVASPLNDITLGQLLSFTSGLNDDVLCNNAPGFDFFECVSNIADSHAQVTTQPGSEFSYGSNHLQVAGAMAVSGGGYESWAELFADFKSVTGLFPHSSYNLPSETNPRLAGGMTWTANDYIDFIRAYRDADIYTSNSLVTAATSDQIADATIVNSPAFNAIAEEWHYGYGLWLECHSNSWEAECGNSPTVSSPGAYGAYPFLNLGNGSFGIVARQGELGSFREGYALFDSVRDTVDDWVACDQ